MKIPTILRKNRKVQALLAVALVAVVFVGLVNTGVVDHPLANYRITVTEMHPDLQGHKLEILIYKAGLELMETVDISSGVGFVLGDYGDSFMVMTQLDGTRGDFTQTLSVGESTYLQFGTCVIKINVDAIAHTN